MAYQMQPLRGCHFSCYEDAPEIFTFCALKKGRKFVFRFDFDPYFLAVHLTPVQYPPPIHGFLYVMSKNVQILT